VAGSSALEGKPMTGPVIIGKLSGTMRAEEDKSFYEEM
jgi:hypothetical protein